MDEFDAGNVGISQDGEAADSYQPEVMDGAKRTRLQGLTHMSVDKGYTRHIQGEEQSGISNRGRELE